MLPENLKINAGIRKTLQNKAHGVYMPHMSASTFLAAWYAAEALPLGEADNYISVAREWENGKMQTANAILTDISDATFVSKQLALDIVRRIHEYRCIGGKDHVYLLLGVVGLKFMDFVEMDEEKKTQIMLMVADAIGSNHKVLRLAKSPEEYNVAKRRIGHVVEGKIEELGFGPRISNAMNEAARNVIDRMIRLGKYIDTQDTRLVQEWMRPFIQEMLEEILNNRGNLEFVVEFILTCETKVDTSKNLAGKQYFMDGGL